MAEKQQIFKFGELVTSIESVHSEALAHASKAVNIGLTMRNWLIGCYICEFELHGADRAEYGGKLLHKLESELQKKDLKRVGSRDLNRYQQFYKLYPHILDSLTLQFANLLPDRVIESHIINKNLSISQSVTAKFQLPGIELVSKLSFTHLSELILIDNNPERFFYEVECIRGNWSVRELRRQIQSLYFIRSGMSKNKEKLAEMANQNCELQTPELTFQDPMIFEFVGFARTETFTETDLENELLNKLQKLIMELGHGFCFEARQKRILIGENYYFVDLVFYHRILNCHVLIELKTSKFSHEHLGQLNTYVSYYRQNMMSHDDNPPVGLLLCTQKDEALVECALSGISNKLFVSKFQIDLPELQQLLKKELIELS